MPPIGATHLRATLLPDGEAPVDLWDGPRPLASAELVLQAGTPVGGTAGS